MYNLNKIRMLKARATIASDLFREGKIERVELFRLELDALLNEDTGEIRYKQNNDFINEEL